MKRHWIAVNSGISQAFGAVGQNALSVSGQGGLSLATPETFQISGGLRPLIEDGIHFRVFRSLMELLDSLLQMPI